MRFIHLSDVHLGSSPESEFAWGADRGEELWESFAAVIDTCNEKKIPLLLIAGDLFDRPPVWDELERVNALFGLLENTQVVMIAGNRDYIKEGSSWSEFPWKPWVYFISDKYPASVYLEEIETSVTGCSFQAAQVEKPYLEDARPDDKGEYQILLGHTGGADCMPADLDALSEQGFDYIALGHSHASKLMQDKKIGFPGSLEPLGKEETGKHGFIIGEISEEKTIIRFIPFSCREYINLTVRLSSDISQEELEKNLTETITESGSQNIYRIIMQGRFKPGSPFDLQRLMELGSISEIEDNTVPDYQLAHLLDDHKEDVIGMYLEEFLRSPAKPVQQRAMYLGLEALLSEEKR